MNCAHICRWRGSPARQATLRDARELWREHWEPWPQNSIHSKLADKLAIPIHPPEKPAAASVTLAPIPKVTPDERLVAREGAPDSSIYPYLPEVELPDVYRGGFPELPIDLDAVGFIGDAGLTAEQRKMLAQNGFVVVPGHHSRFSSAYNSSGWTAEHDARGRS
ncbi:MAG: hypothetical protein IPK52_21880 [Chloroflexi bacterium]|nr:hypothetical protein [Chloroflexota bacterium]